MKSRYFLALILAFGMLLVSSCAVEEYPTEPVNRVPDFPSNPSPTDGTSDIPRNVTLSWTCDDPDGDSLYYDVYFGTDESPPLVIGELTATTYRPPMLDFDTTYYWRVIAWDDKAYGTGGPVWSFSTHSDMVIQFPDAYLNARVREVIGKPTGDIFVSDVDTLTSFNISWRFPSDLSGMEYMTALRSLSLYEGMISDLSPLSGLTGLTDLDVGNNQISDVSPLSNLSALRVLYIGRNSVCDLSPLSGLSRLIGLELSGNRVDDLSPISGLTEMDVLGISHNNISDLSPISNMQKLTILFASGNDVSDLSPLSGLTSLTMLFLDSNDINDLSRLSNLTELTDLAVGYNNIDDLAPLSNLVALGHLRLSGNQIADISPLVDNPGMDSGDTVYLSDNPLSETSINVYIPELEARGVRVYY